MMMRRLLLIGLACGLGTSVLLARPGIVKLKDGQVIEGEVVRDEPGQVTMSIRGIETAISRDRIESLTYTEGFDAEFEKRLAALKPDDAAGRIAVARWAFDNRQYAKARDLLENVLASVDPNSSEAADLLDLVRRQQRLESRPPGERPQATGGDPGANGGGTNDGGQGPQGNGQPTEIPLLSPEDIRKIKLAEIAPPESRVREPNIRVDVPNDVRKEMIELLQVNSRQFADLPDVEKLRLIRENGTAEMLDKVQVQGDPVTIQGFRQRVLPAVSDCVGCHKEPMNGFVMLPRAERSDAATYTSFYLMQQYAARGVRRNEGQGGVFAGGDQALRLINRRSPQDSLLLAFSLPPAPNRISHPDLNGQYKGIFRGTGDQRYGQVLAWIKSLDAIPPSYGVDYRLPGNEPEPAPEPAPQPQQQPAPRGAPAGGAAEPSQRPASPPAAPVRPAPAPR